MKGLQNDGLTSPLLGEEPTYTGVDSDSDENSDRKDDVDTGNDDAKLPGMEPVRLPTNDELEIDGIDQLDDEDIDDALKALEERETLEPTFDRMVLGRTLHIALPTWAGSMAQVATGLLCVALVGQRQSQTDLAAIGLGVVFCNVSGYSIIMGMCTALDTLCPQSFGAGELRLLGLYHQRASVLVLVLAVLPIALLWTQTQFLLTHVGQDQQVAQKVAQFAYLRIPGLLFSSQSQCLIKTLTSIGCTRVVMLSSILASVTGTVVSLILILHLDMGLRGAALAQTSSEFVQFVSIFVLSRFDREFAQVLREYPPWGIGVISGWGPMLRLSFPAMVMQNAEWWSWECLTFLSGLISPEALAAQTIVCNLVNFVYWAPQAVSQACAAIVGQYIGEQRIKAARRAGVLCFFLTMALTGVMCGSLQLSRRQLALLFGGHDDVLPIVIMVIPYGGIFNMLDAVQCALTGVIKGAGKQSSFAPVIVLCYWALGVPLSCLLTFYFNTPLRAAHPLLGLWVGMITGVTLHSSSYLLLLCGMSFRGAAREALVRLRQAKKSAQQFTHDDDDDEDQFGSTSASPLSSPSSLSPSLPTSSASASSASSSRLVHITQVRDT